MFTLNKTDTGIYYLHDYIPVRKFSCYSDEKVEISRQIWHYKDGNIDEIKKFTSELIRAISEIVKTQAGNEFALVAVPPSKVNKKSSVRKSIWFIDKFCKLGIIKRRLNCNKKLVDCNSLLIRVSDVATSHEGRRATYNEHIQSIACNNKSLSEHRMTFIILDDVTTLGTNMDACRDILINHGVKDQNIIRMAIARTV